MEGFLADPMTPFNNPSVIIRDDLGRAVFKLEIKWAADFLHTIVVTSELNNVSTVPRILDGQALALSSVEY